MLGVYGTADSLIKSIGFEYVSQCCPDDVMNGLETDVNCGGVCKTKCLAGQHCTSSADCTSGLVCDVSGSCVSQSSVPGTIYT